MLRDENRKRKRSSASFFQPRKRPRLDQAYDQTPLLKRINAYLVKHDRPQIDERGYCHGIAVVWLQKMAEGKIDWFYNIRDAIIAYPWSRIDEIELDFEKFIAMIEWGQNIDEYLTVKTQDIAQTLESDNVESGLFVGSKGNLSHFFRDRRNVIMYMVWANNHSIAIYQTQGMYYLFNSNYENGYAKIFDNRHIMTEEIMNCLFYDFEIPVPDSLKITIERIRDSHALQYTISELECVDIVEKAEDKVESEPDCHSFCVIL